MFQILHQETSAREIVFRVNLDAAKILADGGPDPAYIREYRYSPTPPDGVTPENYAASMTREIELLAADELSRM